MSFRAIKTCGKWDSKESVTPFLRFCSILEVFREHCRRYGTVPVVRKTGGLNDTVFDVDHDAERAALAGYVPNGFSFEGIDTAGIDYALNRCAIRVRRRCAI